MIVTNYKKISRATPLYPDIMAPDAENILRQKLDILTMREGDLADLRQLVWKTEKEVKQLKDEFNSQASLFNIEYEIKEVKDKETVESFLSIINESDARNK